ncbi:MAG: hypothetical protein HC884_14200, partial [Chloroflexaceae bacterium]|nr:hypothetical protein [Chloroflexaceae bacterium]
TAWMLSPLVLWGAAVVALTVPYLFIVFVRQVPEYERTFPVARPAIYLASYGDEPPQRGFFGFPHRDGWKVVGELYRRGIIQGSYDSNQKSLITLWYIRNAPRAAYGTEPAWYFAARSEGYLFVPEGYALAGSVLVDGRRMLDMYQQGEQHQPVQTFDLRDFQAAFDAQPVPNIPIQPGLFDIIKK